MPKTCAFITLGCKVNQYDTQVLREAFLNRKGYREVPPDSPADLYVINTCAVTSTSEAKSRQEIRKAVRLRPDAEVVVTGCYVKADPKALKGIEGVDLVVDRETLTQSLAGEEGLLAELGISRFEGHNRAFLKIEDGCDANCSYCIIPALRGEVRSKPIMAIAAEAQRLVENGYREIVLTGVHLGAYGRDLDGTTITDVLKGLMNIEGLSRIRLSSLEATEVTDELIELMMGGDKICPHLHLPLQSGDDKVLNAMNRQYTVSQYLKVLERIRSRIPEPSFSTDIIVGFPGEGMEEFENTLRVCREVGFSRMHIFPFSPRRGTPAASMQGQPGPAEVKERKAVLEALAKELALHYKMAFLGKTINVLVEEGSPDGTLSGYSERYIKAQFNGPRDLIGSIASVKVTEVFPTYVRAERRGER